MMAHARADVGSAIPTPISNKENAFTQLSLLEDKIDVLAELVSNLGLRLEGVLVEFGPAVAGSPSADAKSPNDGSALSRRLTTCAYRVGSVCDEVREFMDRLDV